MTKRITDRPLKQAGRKPMEPPRKAAEIIRSLAASGTTRPISFARALGASRPIYSRWMEEHPDLQDAIDEGRAAQELAIADKLYELAMKGNVTALIFLGKARFGWREGDQSDQGNRVNVTIALPGALTLQQFDAIAKEKSNG